jgi:phage terminase large subunit-like protein
MSEILDLLEALGEEDRLKVIAAASQRITQHQRNLAFDPAKLDSRPTPAQQQIITDYLFETTLKNLYVLGGNQSGKTTTMLRILCWLFEESYPGWKRPANWGDEGLTFLLLSRTGKQINESIVPRLQGILTPGTYKIINQGNIAQALHSTKSGNRLIFQSYENENIARERVQSYTIHGVFLDEMPRSYALIEELQRRVQAKRGKLITAFTPKVISQEIRKVVDSSEGVISRKYTLGMMDNPVYTEEDKQRIMSELAVASAAWRNTVLTGAWLTGDNNVYTIGPDMIRAPENYSRSWRHAHGDDPAVNSIHGNVIAAEDPATGFWYIIGENKLSGFPDPTFYPKKVLELTQYLNVVRRVYDPACTYYAQLASKIGMSYTCPWNKNSTERRLEMIKNTQVLLGSKVFIAPWCTELLDELETMQWSEGKEGRVSNADKYHLSDALRYLLDCLPPPEEHAVPQLDWAAQLRKDNQERKARESSKSVVSHGGRIQKSPKNWGRRTWG